MPAGHARAGLHALADAPGFDATLRATAHRRYRATRPLDVPVTVAFGSRDRILFSRSWRRLDELPVGSRLAALPGCGHVPMTDNPAFVAKVLLRGSAPAATVASFAAPVTHRHPGALDTPAAQVATA